MDRIKPKRMPMRAEGQPTTDEDFRELHDQIASFDDIQWIDDTKRAMVERLDRRLPFFCIVLALGSR